MSFPRFKSYCICLCLVFCFSEKSFSQEAPTNDSILISYQELEFKNDVVGVKIDSVLISLKANKNQKDFGMQWILDVKSDTNIFLVNDFIWILPTSYYEEERCFGYIPLKNDTLYIYYFDDSKLFINKHNKIDVKTVNFQFPHQVPTWKIKDIPID
ncbi:MAG: hypothetical protein N4A45_12805 [Flavobacteriales bacterium]|jgi:hypothetical protein|nr:hypothetical protein [Flavobacteriales bacterium]